MFNIFNIDVINENNNGEISIAVDWYFTKTDDFGNSASITGVTNLNNLKKEEFIELNEFKKNKIINEIENFFSFEEIELLKEKIFNQIEINKNKLKYSI